MVPMPTVDTDKLIPSAVSSIPLPAQAAVLRRVRRIFPFQANPVLLAEPPQPRGLRQRPARSEQAIEVLGAVQRKRETRSARANETQGVVKMGSAKGLQAHKVRVERGGPAAYPRLAVFIGMGGPADFFRL